jgi:cytochrome c oxidase subunit I+III
VGIEAMNVISLIGLGIAVVGALVAVLNVLPSIRRDDDVPADPWAGQTLEWATSSPPAPGNFDEQPVVTSAEPLLDQREESA